MDAAAPDWLNILSRVALSSYGVLALQGPNGVSLLPRLGRGDRVSGDSPALLVFALIELAASRHQRLAVGLPSAGRHLPLLTIAGRTLAKTVSNAMADGKQSASGLLFISSDLDIRSRYCDLYVGGSQIDVVHPGSRLRPAGDRVPLTPGRSLNQESGVCFYFPRGELPPRIEFQPSLAVADFRYSRVPIDKQEKILEWLINRVKSRSIIALYSIGDVDTREVLVAAGLHDFPVDHYGLESITTYTVKPATVSSQAGVQTALTPAEQYLERQHRFLQTEQTESDQIVREIGSVLDAHQKINNADFRRARWILATLRQLPVPLQWYEQVAAFQGRSTLRRLIARIGVASRNDGNLGPVLQSLRVHFDRLYRAIEARNTRSELLLQKLTTGSPALNESLLVLTRDATVAKAVRTWIDMRVLQGEEWVDRVNVCSFAELAGSAERRYSKAIVTGIVPRRYRWILGAALADEVFFLTSHDELEIVERQLRSFFLDSTLESAQRSREESLSASGYRVRPEQAIRSELTPKYNVVLPKATLQSPKRASALAKGTSLSDLKTLFAKVALETEQQKSKNMQLEDESWRSDAGADELSEELDSGDDSVSVDLVEAVAITGASAAHGNGKLLLAANVPVEAVLGSAPDELTTVLPPELEAGDIVLLMEEGGRTDLFDRIVELAEGSPELAYLSSYRKQWRDALNRIQPKLGEDDAPIYIDLFKKVKAAGAPIQNWQTVRNWILGITIGPDDPRSIIAVGKVGGSESLARNAAQFDQAFRRIRSIRQGIGRQLSAAIRRHFVDFARGVPEGPGSLDSRLGVPLAELIETIDFVEVATVGEQVTKVPPTRINRFWRNS